MSGWEPEFCKHFVTYLCYAHTMCGISCINFSQRYWKSHYFLSHHRPELLKEKVLFLSFPLLPLVESSTLWCLSDPFQSWLISFVCLGATYQPSKVNFVLCCWVYAIGKRYWYQDIDSRERGIEPSFLPMKHWFSSRLWTSSYFKIFCILTWRDTFCELISSQMQRKSLNVVPCTERLFRILLQNCGEVRIILWYKNWVSEIIAVVLFVLLASRLSRYVCNWSASMFAVLL